MAGSTGAIRAGRAFVELFADDSKLVRGLQGASSKLKAWGMQIGWMGAKIAAGGAAITGPILHAAYRAAEAGAALWDMSKRTGMAVESLSLLGYAAEQSGSDLQGIERAVRQMQKTIAGADDEMEGTSAKGLRELGLSAEALMGLAPEEQFAQIAEKLSAIEDPARKTAAAIKIFGGSMHGAGGVAFLPMIDDFARLAEEVRTFDLGDTGESAYEAKETAHAMTLLGKAIKSTWSAVGSAIFPIIREYSHKLLLVVVSVRNFIREHRELVVLVFKVGVVIGAIGTGLGVLAGAFVTVGVVVAGFSFVFAGFFVAIAAVGNVLAFLLTPLGLGIVVIGALAYQTGVAGKALEWLGKGFQYLRDAATESWKGIGDALATGDISLAAAILWAQLRVIWTAGTSALQRIFSDFQASLAVGWIGSIAALKLAFAFFVIDLQKDWIKFVGFFEEAWATACAAVINLLGSAVQQIGSAVKQVGQLLLGFSKSTMAALMPLGTRAGLRDAGRALESAGGALASGAGVLSGGFEERKAAAEGRTASREAQLDALDAGRLIVEAAARVKVKRDLQVAAAKRNAGQVAAEAALAAAEAELQGLMETARIRRENMEERNAAWAGFDWGPGAPGGPGAPDFGGAVKTGLTAGTFGKFALGGLGMGGGPAERTAKATEKTVDKLDRIQRRLDAFVNRDFGFVA